MSSSILGAQKLFVMRSLNSFSKFAQKSIFTLSVLFLFILSNSYATNIYVDINAGNLVQGYLTIGAHETRQSFS